MGYYAFSKPIKVVHTLLFLNYIVINAYAARVFLHYVKIVRIRCGELNKYRNCIILFMLRRVASVNILYCVSLLISRFAWGEMPCLQKI